MGLMNILGMPNFDSATLQSCQEVIKVASGKFYLAFALGGIIGLIVAIIVGWVIRNRQTMMVPETKLDKKKNKKDGPDDVDELVELK